MAAPTKPADSKAEIGIVRRVASRAFRWFAGLTERENATSLPAGGALLALFLGTVLLSIAIPLVIDLALVKLSGLDQFLIGTLVYLALTMTAQAHHLRRIDATSSTAFELWQIKTDFDRRLNNIRKAYYDLIADRRTDPEFYSAYFARSLEVYETTISEAVTNCELRVDENHLSTTDMLLASFKGRDEDIARFVHYFRDNGWMFDTWARNYCVRLFDLVKRRQLRTVKRLFVYVEEGEQEWDQSKRLIEFHASNAHYDYRVISEETYRNIVRDYRMREQFRDFGVYGDWYVYRTLSAVPDRIEGVFSSSDRKVRDYISLFESCWAHAPVPESSTSGPMTPAELFGAPVVPVSVSPATAEQRQ